jgi:Tol biopolymer transport system component
MTNVARAVAVGATASLMAAAACEIAFPVHEVPAGASLDADGGAVDASIETGPDASNFVDAGPEASAPDGCDPTGTFGAPNLLVFTSFPHDTYAPHLTPDERQVYFEAWRDASSSDLFVARRAGATGPFDRPVELDNLNTSDEEANPMVSADGRYIFYTSNWFAGGAQGEDIFMARREVLDASFSDAHSLSVNSSASDYEPFLRADELFFASDRSGEVRIYHATFVDGVAGPPTNLLEVAPDHEGAPVASADGLTLYIRSRRDGGQGDQDIWVATRANLTAPFSVFTNVMELNSPAHDAPGWLSPDNCRLYFSSTRPGGPSNTNVYVAERQRK